MLDQDYKFYLRSLINLIDCLVDHVWILYDQCWKLKGN